MIWYIDKLYRKVFTFSKGLKEKHENYLKLNGESPDRVLKVSKDSKCKGQHVKVPKFRVKRFRIGELPNLFLKVSTRKIILSS
jgi:hypothetical protein